MRPFMPVFAFLALVTPQAGIAGAEGLYRADEGHELAAELVLRPDGTYGYALSYGSLDEASQGRWREEGGIIRFVTEPRPTPPEFKLAERKLESERTASADMFLTVTWPNGRGIAGIDFRIGFDSGDPIEDYTQYDGWQWPEQEHRTPRWIELAEPVHGIISHRFPIGPGTEALNFVLVPNDFGRIDLTGATATLTGDRLVLHREDARIKFVKATR